MDLKCIRILKPYNDNNNYDMTLYIDDQTRESLNANWGDEVLVEGRKSAKAKIQPLKDMDQDCMVGRVGQRLLDALYIEYGEEVMIK